MKKLTRTQVDKTLTAIQNCEKVANLYNQLYEALAGFNTELEAEDESELNLEIIKGDIISLSMLGKRFDELADQQYRKAQNLYKQIQYSL